MSWGGGQQGWAQQPAQGWGGQQPGMQGQGWQQSGQQGWGQPGMQPGVQPGMQPGVQIGMQMGVQPGMQMGVQPGMQMGVQPGMQMGVQPGWGQQPGQQGWGGNSPGHHNNQWGQSQGQGQGQWGNQGQVIGGFNPIPNQAYKIQLSQIPNMVCDCSQDPNQKFKLVLWSFNGGLNQKWKLLPDGQGNFSIVNIGNEGTLEIPDYAKCQKGQQLHVSQPNGTMNEKWKILQGKGGFAIRAAQNSSLSISVFGGNNWEGDKICLWSYEGLKNQTWNITPC